MIRASAYQTTACAGAIIEPLEDAVMEGYLKGILPPSPQYPNVILVQGGHYVDEKIHLFYHPLVLSHENRFLIGLDVRSTGRYDFVKQEFVVRDKAVYDSLLMRAALNDVWVNESPQYLRSVSNLGLEVFAGWIGEAIAKRLGLGYSEQATISILASIFYLSQFSDKTELDESERVALKGQIIRATRLPDVQVYDIVEEHCVINDITQFCQLICDVASSVRLQNFNAGLLIEIVGGFWYGTAARETVAVALEHPPTWLSLIYRAFTDKGMRNSGLTKILDRGHYQRSSQQFIHALTNLVMA